jgi:Lrp/AsnC family leucine-responsive transcriptional regulator
VAVRVKKLKERGAIETRTGINPLKMGLYMAKVDIASNNPSVILGMFKKCPYFANGFTISGRNNLCLMFVSENISTLESIVNGHLRSNKWVQEVDFNIIISAERDLVVPTILTLEVFKEPPCGIDIGCRDCKSFHEKKCMGCPATGQYQGWFF